MNDPQCPNQATNESNERKHRPLRSVFIALAITIPIILAIVRFTAWPQTLTYYTDADQIKTPSDQAKLREILWQPPQLLPDTIDAGLNAYEARFSDDGLTLYFVRGKAGNNADIYYSQRSHAGWSKPKPMATINSTYDDLGPEPSQDGQSLYFYSDRPGGQGGYDLWVAHRRQDGPGFSIPINLGPRINGEFNDYGPAITPNGDHIYFSSNRPLPSDRTQPNPNAWPSTLREDLFHRTYDIYIAAISDAGFSQAEPVMSLNTPYNEGSPTVSPVDDFLYFASDRPGGSGGFDLYRSRRLRGRHEPPQNLGTSVNTPANELDPGLTMGGYMLVFSSDHPIKRIDPEKPNPYKLFTTTSREVFREHESKSTSINWAAIWSKVWRNLLWALLALLFILMLLALMGGLQNRKLSLLARCLLASLAAHLLLMLLFNVWNVTSTIAKEFRRRGSIQIALAAPAYSHELASQIRGEFTSVENPSVKIVTPTRAKPSIEIAEPIQLASITIQETAKLPGVSLALPTRTNVVEAPIKPTFPLTHQTPPKPNALLPTNIQVDLPNDGQRTSVVENDRHELPKPTNLFSTRRATVPVSLLSPAEVKTLANIEPVSNVRNSVVDLSTMKPTQISLRDAIPLSDTPPMSQSTFATVIPPPSLELKLPDTNSPRATTAEPASVFDGSSMPIQPTPRAKVSTASSATKPSNTNVRLEPNTSHDAISSPSKPGKPTIEMADAPTSTNMTDSHLSLSLEPPTLRLTELSLPSMEQPTEQTTSEVSLALDISQHTPVRAPVGDELETQSNSTSTLIDLQPIADIKTKDLALPSHIPNMNTSIATIPLSPTFNLPQRLPPSSNNAFVLALELPTELEPHNDRLAQREKLARQERLKSLVGREADLLADRPQTTADAIGVVRGLVTDQATGEPLVKAQIWLNLPGRPDLSALTNEAGKYQLYVPSVPDHFALSASKPGYAPSSENVSALNLFNRVVDVDFSLEPSATNIIAIEAVPEVHHLGDNRFEGRINSQFQKEAEGSVFYATFTLDAAQLAAADSVALIQMLAKGVQVKHRLAINGLLLSERLDYAPRDGSFGEFTARFDTDMLHTGANTFHILAGSRGSDVDDFEFVNVQIRLQK